MLLLFKTAGYHCGGAGCVTVFVRHVCMYVNVHVSMYVTMCVYVTSQGGRMSRMPASCSGRSGNPKIAGSSLETTGSKPS